MRQCPRSEAPDDHSKFSFVLFCFVVVVVVVVVVLLQFYDYC